MGDGKKDSFIPDAPSQETGAKDSFVPDAVDVKKKDTTGGASVPSPTMSTTPVGRSFASVTTGAKSASASTPSAVKLPNFIYNQNLYTGAKPTTRGAMSLSEGDIYTASITDNTKKIQPGSGPQTYSWSPSGPVDVKEPTETIKTYGQAGEFTLNPFQAFGKTPTIGVESYVEDPSVSRFRYEAYVSKIEEADKQSQQNKLAFAQANPGVNVDTAPLSPEEKAKQFASYYMLNESPDSYMQEQQAVDYWAGKVAENNTVENQFMLQKARGVAGMNAINLYQTANYYAAEIDRERLNNNYSAQIAEIDNIGRQIEEWPKNEEGQPIANSPEDVDKWNALVASAQQISNDKDFMSLSERADKRNQNVRESYEAQKQIIKQNPLWFMAEDSARKAAAQTEVDLEKLGPVFSWKAKNIDNPATQAVVDFAIGVSYVPKAFGGEGYDWTDAIYDKASTGRALSVSPYLPVEDSIVAKTVSAATTMALMVGTGYAIGATGAALGLPTRIGSVAGQVTAGTVATMEGYYRAGIEAGMTESEAESYSLVSGLVQGMLEMVNPEAAFAGPALFKKSADAYMDVIVKGGAKSLARKEAMTVIGKNILGENIQEFTQQIAEWGINMKANQITGANLDVGENAGPALAETAVITTLLSGIVGGVQTGGIKVTENRLTSEATYITGKEPLKYKERVASMLAAGEITQEKAAEINAKIDQAQQIVSKIPSNIPPSEAVDQIPALMEKMRLEEELKKVDPAFKPAVEEQIAQVEKQMQQQAGIVPEEEKDQKAMEADMEELENLRVSKTMMERMGMSLQPEELARLTELENKLTPKEDATQKGIKPEGNQQQYQNGDQTRQEPEAGRSDSAQQSRQVQEKIKDRASFEAQAKVAFPGMTDEQRSAGMAVLDAYANTWAQATGKTVDEFYAQHFAQVTEGGEMAEGALLQEGELFPPKPVETYSLSAFNTKGFAQMRGRNTSKQAIRQSLNQQGIKDVEKQIINQVLDERFAGQEKFSFDDFALAVSEAVMPLEKITTNSYSSYGKDSTGDRHEYGSTGSEETIIFNSPIEHGETGHFSGDFGAKPEGAWTARELKDGLWAAFDSSADTSDPANLMGSVGTVGSKEQVEKWIADYDEAARSGKTTPIGLFGHIRVWPDTSNKVYNVAELQSDFFQKSDPEEIGTPNISNSEIAAEAKDEWSEFNIQTIKKAAEDLGFKVEVGEFTPSDSWTYKYKVTHPDGDVSYYHEQDGNNSVSPEADTWINIASRADMMGALKDKLGIEAYAEYRGAYRAKQKEINAAAEQRLKEKYANSPAKENKYFPQFAAHKKNYVTRLLREAIKDAAARGFKKLRIPSPYTIAVIEGYVDKNGEGAMPYEIQRAGDSTFLVEGDTIYFEGEDYTVVESNSTTITVAPSDEVSTYTYDDLYSEKRDGISSDATYEVEKHFDSPKAATKEEMLSFSSDWSSLERDVREVAEDMEDEDTHNVYDIIEKFLYKYMEGFDAYDYARGFGAEVFTNDHGEIFYVVESRRSTQSLNQPDEYQVESNKEDFKDNLSDEQKTVVRKYEELGRLFAKERKDAREVTDGNDLEWLETDITDKDVTSPVVVFQKEEGQAKGAVEFMEDGKAIVRAFGTADFSTFVHESAHVIRRSFSRMAEETGNEQLKQDVSKLEEWAGAKDGQWNVAAEEKFARGMEKYLADGVAPTPGLKGTFERIKGFMLDIYKSLSGSSVDVEITPEIRDVFDRMLGKTPAARASAKVAQQESVDLSELKGKRGAFMSPEKKASLDEDIAAIEGMPYNKAKAKAEAMKKRLRSEVKSGVMPAQSAKNYAAKADDIVKQKIQERKAAADKAIDEAAETLKVVGEKLGIIGKSYYINPQTGERVEVQKNSILDPVKLIDIGASMVKRAVAAGIDINVAINSWAEAVKNHPAYKNLVSTQGQDKADEFVSKAKESFMAASQQVQPPDVDTKMSRIAKTMMESDKVSEEVKQGLQSTGLEYVPQGQKLQAEEADAIIGWHEQHANLEGVLDMVTDMTNGMKPDARAMLATQLYNRYTEMQAQAVTEGNTELATKYAYRAGQALGRANNIISDSARALRNAARQIHETLRRYGVEAMVAQMSGMVQGQVQQIMQRASTKKTIKTATSEIDKFWKMFSSKVPDKTARKSKIDRMVEMAERLDNINGTTEYSDRVKEYQKILAEDAEAKAIDKLMTDLENKLTQVSDRAKRRKIIVNALNELNEKGKLTDGRVKKLVEEALFEQEFTPELQDMLRKGFQIMKDYADLDASRQEAIKKLRDDYTTAMKTATPEEGSKLTKAFRADVKKVYDELVEARFKAEEQHAKIAEQFLEDRGLFDMLRMTLPSNLFTSGGILTNLYFNLADVFPRVARAVMASGMDAIILPIQNRIRAKKGLSPLTRTNRFGAQLMGIHRYGLKYGLKEARFRSLKGIQSVEDMEKFEMRRSLKPIDAAISLFRKKRPNQRMYRYVEDKIAAAIEATSGSFSSILLRAMSLGDVGPREVARFGKLYEIAVTTKGLTEREDIAEFVFHPDEESAKYAEEYAKELVFQKDRNKISLETLTKVMKGESLDGVQVSPDVASQAVQLVGDLIDLPASGIEAHTKGSESEALREAGRYSAEAYRYFATSQFPFKNTYLRMIPRVLEMAWPGMSIAKATIKFMKAAEALNKMDELPDTPANKEARDKLKFAHDMFRNEGLAAVSQAAIATSIAATAIYFVAQGIITGGDDKDELGRQSGKGPYKLNLSALTRIWEGEGWNKDKDGDVWVSYDWFGMNGLVLGATVDKLKKDGQIPGIDANLSILDALNGAGLNILPKSLDMPLIKSSETLLDALRKGDNSWEKWEANTLSAMITGIYPNILQAISRTSDEYDRDIRSGDTDPSKPGVQKSGVDEVGNRLLVSTYRGDKLPPKVDIFGHDIKSTTTGQDWVWRGNAEKTDVNSPNYKLWQLRQQFPPDSPSWRAITPSPLEIEQTFSYYAYGKTKVSKTVSLDPWQLHDLSQQVGLQREQALKMYMSTPQWETDSPTQKAENIEKLWSDATKAGKMHYMMEHPEIISQD